MRLPWNLRSPVYAIEPADVCIMNPHAPGSEWSTGRGSNSMESTLYFLYGFTSDMLRPRSSLFLLLVAQPAPPFVLVYVLNSSLYVTKWPPPIPVSWSACMMILVASVQYTGMSGLR